MQPITQIVAATDFSVKADLATQRAGQIAKQLGAVLHLIHVVHPLNLYAGSELAFACQMHYQQAQQQAVKSQLEALSTKLQEQFGISVVTVTRIGRAHAEIASYALTHSADLIVAGAQGENAMLAMLLGSTTLRLLRVSKCPVLVVKNHNHGTQAYQQVVAAVDFSLGSADVPALARAIAPSAHIEALLIFDSSQEAHLHKAGIDEALLNEYKQKAEIDAEKRLVDLVKAQQNNEKMTYKILAGYPSESICKRAKEVQADLIVIGKHNKSNIEDWLLGSVSKGVAYAAECDVLLNN